jgi:hypothetical protein
LVRLRDKINRISSNEKSVNDEGLTENFLDIANYGLMGALMSNFGIIDKCEHLYSIPKENQKILKLICIKCNHKLTVSGLKKS